MKMLICGVSDVVFTSGLCIISLFVLLALFFIFYWFFLFVSGFYLVLNDLVYFVEWEVITLNSSRVVMTFLLD
jgi:hypothetical protein